MGNIIVGFILIIIVFFAVRSSMKHFQGEGGCCGGRVPKPKRKKLEGTRVAQKRISIEGMHCENCRNSVENQLNQIEGAVAKVDLKKNMAIVTMNRMIEDDELRKAVEGVDFKVTKIEFI